MSKVLWTACLWGVLGSGSGECAATMVTLPCDSPASVAGPFLQIDVSEVLVSPSVASAKKQRFFGSPVNCKKLNAKDTAEIMPVIKTDFSQESYACFKYVVAEWPWQRPAAFKKHWQQWWTKAGWDIYEHAWFLMAVLTGLWLSRPRLQRSVEQARKNIYLQRFCEAINHAAQDQEARRDVRLVLSTESLMRYVDDFLGEHHYKENFKTFLRCGTYSKDYILPL